MDTLEPSGPALAPRFTTTDVLPDVTAAGDGSRVPGGVAVGNGASSGQERRSPSSDALPAPSELAPGSIAACLVACGIACTVFGLTVVVAEASAGLKKALEFYEPAGSLSGKGIVATGVWLASWAVLHLRLRNRDVVLRPYTRTSLALIALGFLGTFPPFFRLFAAH